MLPNKSNKTQESCSPISSNCVIWQGPDIPCINLCNGDSVSDVVAKLALELCEVLTQLNINTYDLTCFNPMCPKPEDFKDMIQFILNYICEDSGKVSSNTNRIAQLETRVGTGCPDCVVTVAPCFYYTNSVGDTVTTMQLKDYVIAAGNRICTLLTQISVINTSIADLDQRVTNIETKCCNDAELPTVPTSCLNPTSFNIPLVNFVVNLENAFCSLQTVTGTPTELSVAIGSQCVTGADLQLGTNAPNAWSTNPSFIGSPTKVSNTINNLWLTICDLREAVGQLQSDLAACCSVSCSDINLAASAIFTKSTTSVDITFTGSFPGSFAGCVGTSTITIQGSNGTTPYVNNSATVSIGTLVEDISSSPIYNSLYYIPTVQACYTDGTSTCTQTINLPIVEGNLDCPPSLITAWSNPAPGVGRFTFTSLSTTPVTYILTVTNITSGSVEYHTVNATTAGVYFIQNSVLGDPGDGFELTSVTMTQGIYSKTCSSNGYIYYITA
jgi:hypothetical protein